MSGFVTAQAIGAYERGQYIPSPSILSALAKALGASLRDLIGTQGMGVEFRTKPHITAKERDRATTQVLDWIDRYLQVELVLGLESDTWQCPVPHPLKLNEITETEKLAEQVRHAWKLGSDPIADMTELLEE